MSLRVILHHCYPRRLSRLPHALQPSVIVTAADLEKIGTRVPEFYAGDLFCPIGKTPFYMGQPVALLIFEGFDAFDRARDSLAAVGVIAFTLASLLLVDLGLNWRELTTRRA